MQPKVSHIGIILDGNRRFARKLLKEPWKGHEYGAQKVEPFFDWCRELEIKEATLYIFSLQNFNRSKKEVEYLMNLFCDFFGSERIKGKIQKNKIKINFIGRTHLLPPKVQEQIQRLAKETQNYADFKVNFAIAYGGRE